MCIDTLPCASYKPLNFFTFLYILIIKKTKFYLVILVSHEILHLK